MADETVRELILRAQDGEVLSPAEVERVKTWMREDFGPAVRQANEAITAGLTQAFKQLGAAFESPAGKQLVALAREYEASRPWAGPVTLSEPDERMGHARFG